MDQVTRSFVHKGQLVEDGVELADLISQLRSELSRAMWAGENSDLRFEAETVELELTVAVEKSLDPGVKVRFLVLDAGANKRSSTVITQRMTLTLRPVQASSPDRPAVISGRPLRGER